MVKRILMLTALACFVLVGCMGVGGSKSSYNVVAGDVEVDHTAKFAVGRMIDKSGFAFAEEDKDDAFDLGKELENALRAELERRNSLGTKQDPAPYSVEADIQKFAVGGGSANVVLTAIIYGGGRQLARIPLEHAVSGPNAGKVVLAESAKRIVEILKDPKQRKALK